MALQVGYTGPVALDTSVGLVVQPDGRVVGSSWVGTAIYDPASNLWTGRATPNVFLASACVEALPGGKVLRAGGSNGVVSSTVYDPATDTWTSSGNLNVARTRASCGALADGRVVIMGGLQFGLGTNSAEIFDPATMTWTQISDAKSGGSDSKPVRLDDGRLFFYSSTPQLFDPSTNQFTIVGTPADRASRGARLPDGRVLLVDLGSARIFDPASGAFVPVAAPPTLRFNTELVTLANGDVLVAGGTAADGQSSLSTVEIFHPSTETWTMSSPLLQQREGHAMLALDALHVLVAGGSYRLSSTWFAVSSGQAAEIVEAACTPVDCASAGLGCGVLSDGCGGQVDCGSCSPGLACIANQCVACSPLDCEALGSQCGVASDGCGGQVQCGTCDVGASCVANQCVTCVAATCEMLGFFCGAAADGCGGQLSCGECASGSTCETNVCRANPSARTAVRDSALRAPGCALTASSCDSGSTLVGRGPLGPEPSQPNTLNSGCADGTYGSFHSDESLDRLRIYTTDGSALAPGKTVTVEATVWSYSPSGVDIIDFFSAPNASAPVWTWIASIPLNASGAQVRTASFTLPNGGLQAVRGQFRFGGSAVPCSTGGYDDHDDLFFVASAGDTQSPAVSISAPTAGAVVGGMVDVAVQAADDSGIASVRLYVDQALVGVLSAAPWIFSWDSRTALQGRHTLLATAIDGAGNPASTTALVTVDNAPTSVITSPLPTDTLTGLVNVGATATAVTGRSIVSVEFLVDGVSVGVDEEDPYAIAWDSRSVGNGPHTISARAIDSSGLAREAELVNVTSSNDFDAPAVVMETPMSGAFVGGVVSIVGSASDASGVQSIDVSVDGTVLQTVGSTTFSLTWDSTSANDGPHVFEVRAIDTVGNVETISVTVVVDNTAPTVVLTAPGAGPLGQGLIAISADATDSNQVARVDFYVDGALQSSALAPPYSAAWDSTGLGGTHVLMAVAVDAAGNQASSAPVSVIVVTSQLAAYSSVYRAPYCATLSTACSTGGLVDGRRSLGPEPHQPNTIGSSCPDGSSGTYHGTGESNDAVVVRSVNGSPLVPGQSVMVEATIWAVDPTDRVDVWYAADANAPGWIRAATVTPTRLGAASTVSATYTLPAGSTQAVRVSLRRGGSAVSCPSGNRNDRDDIVFVTQ